jgi:hypothetical protein
MANKPKLAVGDCVAGLTTLSVAVVKQRRTLRYLMYRVRQKYLTILQNSCE